jgi:hypothetical protein
LAKMFKNSLQNLSERAGLRMQIAQGRVHGWQQTDEGAAADHGEVFDVVALSSGMDQLPAQLQKTSGPHPNNGAREQTAVAIQQQARQQKKSTFSSAFGLNSAPASEGKTSCTCFIKWLRIFRRFPAAPVMFGSEQVRVEQQSNTPFESEHPSGLDRSSSWTAHGAWCCARAVMTMLAVRQRISAAGDAAYHDSAAEQAHSEATHRVMIERWDGHDHPTRRGVGWGVGTSGSSNNHHEFNRCLVA